MNVKTKNEEGEELENKEIREDKLA